MNLCADCGHRLRGPRCSYRSCQSRRLGMGLVRAAGGSVAEYVKGLQHLHRRRLEEARAERHVRAETRRQLRSRSVYTSVSLDAPLVSGLPGMYDRIPDATQPDPADLVIASDERARLRQIVGELEPSDIAELTDDELTHLRSVLRASGFAPKTFRPAIDGAWGDVSLLPGVSIEEDRPHWTPGWHRDCGWSACTRQATWHVIWATGDASFACPVHAADAYDQDPEVMEHFAEPDCRRPGSYWDPNDNLCIDADELEHAS